jgi:hypothetical protein
VLLTDFSLRTGSASALGWNAIIRLELASESRSLLWGSFASNLACPQHVRLRGNLGNAGFAGRREGVLALTNRFEQPELGEV